MSRAASIPSSSGIATSMRTTSGSSSCARCTASAPFAASPTTSKPGRLESCARSIPANRRSSSAITILTGPHSPCPRPSRNPRASTASRLPPEGTGNPSRSERCRQNRSMLSPAVENLVAQLSRLPGVGTRTAHRLAFHLLQRSKEEALALATAIEDVKERVRFCNECGNLTEDQICAICLDARRDHTLICVVEQPVDLLSVERTSEFRGLYHVLGGALSPIDGVDPEHLRIDELLGRVERNGVQEVVLATNPNMTGEATAAYVADRLRGRVRVTRLASGLPVGADLEYADEVTLGRALSGRREM